MSFVYDNKANASRTRPGSQGYSINDPNAVSNNLNGTYGAVSGYGQYNPVQQPSAQRSQQTGQAQSQQQQPQAATQQPQFAQGQINRPAYPYNVSYSQYDQPHNYNQIQQMQQQQQQQQQYPQNIYQQQQYTGLLGGNTNTALPYAQGNYLTPAYQSMPNANYGATTGGASSASSNYAYPYQANVQPIAADTSPYRHQPQLSSVSNVAAVSGNASGARPSVPMQQSLLDPNQLPQRPKLTTTFWEDEGTVCYQVESRGIPVSRREDTNFINGTKLLNVAGMTRGRRDGILKSEKVRYVVKIGAMNLKGVWIPFERALELARNEGIVDLLYPLFVKDIKEVYQGPQFSGGLTAAANSNPKNIIPVTVTNSNYTPGSFDNKDKKKQTQASQPQPVSENVQQQPTEAQHQTQQYPYGYAYNQYQASIQDPQYAAISQEGNASASQYKQTGSFYGYQAPLATGNDPSKEYDLKPDNDDKSS